MGINGKSQCLRRIAHETKGFVRTDTLIDSERLQVEIMSSRICNAVAKVIEQQPYVTQNVLSHTMAKVVAMTMKLHYDIWKDPLEFEFMKIMIGLEWQDMKDKKIDYGTCTEPGA